MKISLYIPCFNAQDYIKDVLEGVFNQSLRPDEVVIVDDASTDKTVEKALSYPVKVIKHANNKGLAAARNTAVKSINSEFVASLDADCVPESNWLEILLKSLGSLKTAGAGGKLLEKSPSTISDMWRCAHMKQYWEKEGPAPSFLFGSNTVFRRQALTEVGIYNEDFKNNYEDVDICGRLKKEGWNLAYEPKAKCRHLKRDNVSSMLNSYWNWNLAFYQKEGCYSNPEEFSRKLKENVGLANRYMREDIASNRAHLLYLDFLLGIHQSLKDLEYFIFHKDQKSDYPVSSFWFSLLDLTFFYHFDFKKKGLATLMPKKNTFLQNFFALNLILGKSIKEKFKSSKFKKMIYKHLLLSIYSITDKVLLDKLLIMTESRPDWSQFYEKKHPNLNSVFLKELSFSFREWLNSFAVDCPEAIRMIETSAEKMDE